MTTYRSPESTRSTTTPFLYAVGWSEINAWYLGCRYAQGCQPLDLWTTYFTSSTMVATLRRDYGEPDSFAILHTGSVDEIRDLEHQVIVQLGLYQGTRWLNRGTWGVGGDPLGTERARARHSESLRAFYSNPENCAARRQEQVARWADPEARARQREKLIAHLTIPEHRAAKAEQLRSCWTDEVFRQKMIDSRKRVAADPEWKARESEKMTTMWQNPAYRERSCSRVGMRNSVREGGRNDQRQPKLAGHRSVAPSTLPE